MGNVALVVTVDVEEDMPRWVVEPEITVRNAAALPRLQLLCDEFGVRPTYLVTYPMATQSASKDVLGELQATGRCELGAHLHPWNTPPLPNGPELDPLRPTEIAPDTMAARMIVLTRELERTFGSRPRVFRAGRFGFNGNCLRVLEQLGYTVDSSITPGISWAEEGGEDYTDAPDRPYFPDRRDPRRIGDSPVLEVPVSTGFTRSISSRVKRLYRRLPRWTRLRGLLSNEHTGLLDFYWLCPGQHNSDELIRLADVLIDDGAPMLNVFFHSSELWPGMSVYTKNELEVDAYFERLRRLFRHVMSAGATWGATLSELRASWVESLEADAGEIGGRSGAAGAG